jgi:dienelactone hydrolase
MAARVVILTAACLCLAAAGAASARAFPHFGAGCARADFRTSLGPIRAERCGPSKAERAVVVLHGCGGFSTFDHQLAVDLPRYGIATLYVDYFQPTPPTGKRGYCSLGHRDPGLFGVWETVAVDAAASLRRHYRRVGAVGWSLGAGVAVAAAEDHHAFDAVAAFSALASARVLQHARALPPTIFLSGGSRDIVKPENARRLFDAARRAGVPAALFVYPNGTHDWPGKQGETGRLKAARFLLRRLRYSPATSRRKKTT